MLSQWVSAPVCIAAVCCYTDGWCCSLCIVVVVHAYVHYASVVLRSEDVLVVIGRSHFVIDDLAN